MKRNSVKCALALLLALCLGLALTGCGEAEVQMYVEPAQLTREEQNMAKLLGADGVQYIFDFRVDETVRTVCISLYQWVDGDWEAISGGEDSFVAFTDTEGRIALNFENLEAGFREAIQSGDSYNSTTLTRPVEGDTQGSSRATTILTERTDIAYQEEIPLVIQVATDGSELRSFDLSYFFQPEVYADYNYTHIYAITLRFGQ